MSEAYLGMKRVPITRVHVPEHIISQIKSAKKDGYRAVQVAFGKPKKNTTKPLKGHLKKLNKAPRHLREIPLEDQEKDLEVGKKLQLTELIKQGDVVSVQGTTKGKGFTGVVKRWGFSTQPKTHGQSDRERAPGSIGQTTGTAHVFKGKKMAGRHGGKAHTVKNAKVVYLDEEKQEVWLTGSVPGNKNSVLALTITNHLDDLPLPHSKQSEKDKKQTIKKQAAEKAEKKQQKKTREKPEEKDEKEDESEKAEKQQEKKDSKIKKPNKEKDNQKEKTQQKEAKKS